jgi:AraC-like DNA-binding protein
LCSGQLSEDQPASEHQPKNHRVCISGRLGVSPHAYFILRRLDYCKRALAAANPGAASVTAIATQCGFNELGRFAAIYRHHFGELPSETLRRTRLMIPAGISPIGYLCSISIPRRHGFA